MLFLYSPPGQINLEWVHQPPAQRSEKCRWIFSGSHYLILFDYLSLCRCLKVLTKPRISSMCTRQSFPRCVVSNWTTTIKQGICSQVSVCATFLTLGRKKTAENQKQTKCSFVYLDFWQKERKEISFKL